MLCQSECARLHKTVNMVVFFVKSNENTYPKGRELMKMYRVVPITKRGNYNSELTELWERYLSEFSFIQKYLDPFSNQHRSFSMKSHVTIKYSNNHGKLNLI